MSGQMHLTFHPTLVSSMLDEMLDALDQGLRRFNLQWGKGMVGHL